MVLLLGQDNLKAQLRERRAEFRGTLARSDSHEISVPQ